MSEKATRDKILDAMYDLVAENGYDKSSIGKICDIVGISKPSVYYYFESKEEIFTTLLDSMFPTIDYERDYSSITDKRQYRGALLELGLDIISGYRDDEKRRKVLAEVNIQSSRIPAVAKRQLDSSSRTMKTLENILLHGNEIEAFSPAIDPHHYAQLLYTMLEGMSQTVAQQEDIDEKSIWCTIIEMLFK